MSRSDTPISRSSDDFAIPRASTYNRILRMTSNILLPVAAPRRRPRLWRFLALTVLLLLFVVAAGIAWLISVARSALPDLDGALPVSGISAPVSVNRDSHGVPTIEAATLDDLFFAQGYVTAQDRLFQMDLMRRAAAGDLSESGPPQKSACWQLLQRTGNNSALMSAGSMHTLKVIVTAFPWSFAFCITRHGRGPKKIR